MTTKARSLVLLTLAVPLLAAQAQTTQGSAATTPAPAPALSSTEQTIKDIKNPVSWMTWGGDLRLRNEYFDNAQSLTSDHLKNGANHSQDYFRFRGRIWTSLLPIENVSVNARLAAEPRLWMEPSSAGNYGNQSGFEGRFGIIDNLNVQWKKPLDLPATVTVGRQDFMPGRDAFVGDGWLIADGTPGDGSWTYFFDSARLTLDLKDQHTTIDAVGIIQDARPDAWLPTMGPSTTAGDPNKYFLTDQNEKGAILNIANKSIRQANVDGYFIYKQDNRVNTDPRAGGGDNADIYTLGARVSGLVADHWKYSAEGAYQFGEKQDPNLLNSDAGAAAANKFHDISAYGGNARFGYLFNDKLNSQVYLAGEFLSGDDPKTGDDEMFDVLWGRWPRWSELYNIYSYIPETRVGQTANLIRIGPGWTCSPTKKMDLIFNYNALFADQDVPTRANPKNGNADRFSDDGNFRGHYLQAVVKYKFSAHMTGHLWSEFIWPGDYYASKQVMTFLRAEVMFTF